MNAVKGIVLGVILAILLFIGAGLTYAQDFRPWPYFSNEQQMVDWVYNHVQYDRVRAASMGSDIQTWQVTLTRHAGVCRDEAVLLMAILKYQYREDTWLVCIALPDGELHAIVDDNRGHYLDPTNDCIISDLPGYEVARFEYSALAQ